MTDAAFNNELWIYCYKNQIDGYPLGHPCRTNFHPIVPTVPSSRQKTLDLAVYSGFSQEDRTALLVE